MVRDPGSINRAHQSNELVERAQIEARAALLRKLGDGAVGDEFKFSET